VYAVYAVAIDGEADVGVAFCDPRACFVVVEGDS
jgi:hypothetical protein